MPLGRTRRLMDRVSAAKPFCGRALKPGSYLFARRGQRVGALAPLATVTTKGVTDFLSFAQG